MISTISIVGVDDSISPSDLVDISIKYPFVEWGVNLHPSPKQRPSVPSESWLEELLTVADKLRLLGVLQGRWLCDIKQGVLSIKQERPDLWDIFQRIKIDVTNGLDKVIESVQLISDKHVIMSTNDTLNIYDDKLDIYPLFPRDRLFTGYGNCGYQILPKDIDIVKKVGAGNWVELECHREDGVTIDLFEMEKWLDLFEENIPNDSWISALLETKAIKKRFSETPKQ